MRASAILIAIASAGLTACGPYHAAPRTAQAEGCQFDTQCKGDRICEKNRCVAGPARPKLDPVAEPQPDEGSPPPKIVIGDCYEGNIQDCYDMGMKWVFGIEGPEDPGQARAYFHKACQGGHIFGCMMLGLLLEEKSADKEGAVAGKCRVFGIDHYEKGCEDGDGEACYNAARLLDGQSIYRPERDRKRARGFYKQACTAGIDKACKKANK
jgi:TPR repeat protein